MKLEAAGSLLGRSGNYLQEPHLDNAGWRYGFLAYKEDGSRIYSDTFSKPDGTAEFTVPANARFLWLVVMGAPTEHWIRPGGRGRRTADAPAPANEQWPYEFDLTGTAPDDSMIR